MAKYIICGAGESARKVALAMAHFGIAATVSLQPLAEPLEPRGKAEILQPFTVRTGPNRKQRRKAKK